MLDRGERERKRALNARSPVWRNHKAPLAECADVGQCIEGRCPPPYAVDVRCSTYFLFISFFLSFSPYTVAFRRRILYPRPGLVPGLSIPHRSDTCRTVLRGSHVSRDDRKRTKASPPALARFALRQGKKKKRKTKKKDERCTLEL